MSSDRSIVSSAASCGKPQPIRSVGNSIRSHSEQRGCNMCTKRLSSSRGLPLTAAALAAAFAALPVNAKASTISWGVATSISSPSDVSTAGTLVQAYALGDSSPVTVNGVTFTGVDISADTSDMAVGVDTVTADMIGNYNGFGPASSSLSSSYQTLIGSAAFEANGNQTPLTLQIAGLTPGQSYLFEGWVNDSRPTVSWSETFADSLGNSVSLQFQTPSDLGQFAVGAFTASTTGSQSVVITGTSDSQLNAFQVRAVPEPATLGLMVAGALGLLLLERRKAG